MKVIQTKFLEKINTTHFIFNNFFPRKYEIIKKKYSTPGEATDDNMMRARWLRQPTQTLGICYIYCLPLQQWLHERATPLRYMYIACLVTLESLKSRSRNSSRSFNRASSVYCIL